MKARTILGRLLLGTALSFALLLLGLMLAAVLGISINAAPWRAAIAMKATALLGRSVTLEGPLRLTIGLRPELTVGGIVVANPPGFSSPQFATLGRAHMLVELWPLLRNEISVLEMNAEDVHVRLEEAPDGRVNWSFSLQSAGNGTQTHRRTEQRVRLEEIDRFALKRVDVELIRGGTTRSFALDELDGQARAGKPIAVTLHGKVEKTFPYTVSIAGGTLADLYRADKPWPLQIGLEFVGTAAHIDGTIRNAVTNPVAEVLFGIGTEDPSEIERLFQTQLPPVGATGLSGRISWAGRRITVTDLRGVMGKSVLEGELAFDLRGAKPQVTGRLHMPIFDLQPFVSTNVPAAEGDKVADLRKTYSEIERTRYDLRQMSGYDGELLLRVDRWLGMVGDVRDSELRITLHNGQLQAPVQTTVADVALSGELDIDALKPTPAFSLWLGTQRSKLGRLAQVFASIPGVEGEVGKFRLALEGQGNNLFTIVHSLSLKFELMQGRLSYGHIEGGKPVEVQIDSFQMSIPAGGKLSGGLRGSLVGTPFQARFAGGDLPTLTSETRWPFQLDASASGAVFHLSGVLAAPEAQSGTDVEFELSAKRAGDVARWFGLSRDATAPIFISAHVRLESDEWRMDRVVAQLGKTALHAELARTGIGKKPLVLSRVVVDHLDVPELEAMLPPRDPSAPRRAAIDLPILPHGIDLFDSDVDVQVKQVFLRRGAITDVSFNGHIREGRMWPSPFSVKVAGAPFTGAMAIDLRGQVPEASVWVAAHNVNLGDLLKRLGVVESLEASTQLVRAELIGRGSRLGEMLQRSSLLAELEEGALTLRDANGKWDVPIKLTKGTARAAPGERVHLDLDGAINTTPVSIRVASGALPDFMQALRVPFSVSADTSGVHLELVGSAALPITQQEAELELTAHGARFDSLNQLARVELPPWGPWEVKGRFRAWKSGYEMPDMRVQIGDSKLSGHGSLMTTGVRPRLDLDLTAQQIQLDDFALNGFTFAERGRKAERPLSVEEMRAKAKQAAADSQKLLSPQFMRKLDASVRVEVAQVLSGRDQLGSGSLNAQLNEGRFSLEPMEVNVPGGSARIGLMFEPTEAEVQLAANISVDRFDYGILARRLKPDVNMQGWFSLHMDIRARAPTLDTVMQHADGRIDFAVWPRDLNAGIFDLWAVNLFLALLPTIDPGQKSKVNCVVGRFNLRAGKLSHGALLMDTSRMRVNGRGQVDFDTEGLRFRLEPRAKEPQFFSLATPVEVDGKITDFHIRVSGSDLLGTSVRFFTSWIIVPLQKLGGRGLPRDGGDVCGNNALREGKR